jgi:hypothetical protein
MAYIVSDATIAEVAALRRERELEELRLEAIARRACTCPDCGAALVLTVPVPIDFPADAPVLDAVLHRT